MPARSVGDTSIYWSEGSTQENATVGHDAYFFDYLEHSDDEYHARCLRHKEEHTRQIPPIKSAKRLKCPVSSTRILVYETETYEKERVSPKSVSSTDPSSTRSPPTSWTLPLQTSSSIGQSNPWGQTGRNSPAPNQYLPAQPRVHHSSYLHDSQTRSYHLDVVQHPQRTAEFGTATLSRLPLSPPIVVQLIVRDRFGNSIIPEMELPFLIAHLSLYSDDGLTSLDMASSPDGESPPRRLLYGNLVSSAQKLRDLEGRLGLYFLFPDASIRWRGRFQLGVTLLRISFMDASGAMSIAEQGSVLAQTRTRSFDVLPHENYVAPAQTRLTQCFLRQGARIHAFTPSVS